MHGNGFRIALLLLCATAAFLYWQQQSKIFEDKGRLQVSQEGNSVVLSWRSDIDVPMERRIIEALSEWKDKTSRFVFDLDSPGGALREGNKVIKLMDDLKRTHTVVTRVGPRSICLSMCVPIYLQGEERLAAPTSRWMFHEPRFVDFFTGEEDPGPEFEQRYFSERFFERYFVNSEMNPQWRDALRQVWVGKDIWRTGQQLVDEGSNIVTRLE